MADTAPTTPSNPEAEGRSTSWPTIAIAGTLALLLIALGAPRLIGGVALLGGDAGVRMLTLDREVDDSSLESIMSSRTAATKWIDSGRAHVDAGRAAVLLAGRLRDRPYPPVDLQLNLMRQAREQLEAGLALRPGDSFAWTLYAYTLLFTGGTPERFDQAITMSLRTGPKEPRLMAARIDIALSQWPKLKVDTRRVMLDQVRLAATHVPMQLATVARLGNRIEDIRQLLGDRPELARNFDDMLFEPDELTAQRR